jgi:hypothetical protein
MLQKWFEHNGCNDLARIAEYIDAYNVFQRANGNFITQYVELQLNHLRECTAGRKTCRCPPEPKGLVTPTLEDYKARKTEACSIDEVLRHLYVERLSTEILVQHLFYLILFVYQSIN